MVDRYFKKTYTKNSNNYYLNVKGKEEVMQPATKKSKRNHTKPGYPEKRRSAAEPKHQRTPGGR